MKFARLHRLFNPQSGRCFDVALDHGFFNEGRFLAGIEDLSAAVNALIEAAPDAIQLTVGQAMRLQAHPARPKPALVLRTDTANIYGRELPRTLFSRMIGEPVLQAAGVLYGLHEGGPMEAVLSDPSCSRGVRPVCECLALVDAYGFQST
jgi:DhnA family fructose-bisphosphate aldolase class Ia